jgi:cyclophilin family peptidyl-prolyl cis-trans isomerase/HEAT repeat protein
MADQRHVDSLLIGEALASRSSWIRATAALAIGQVRDRSLAGRLRALLVDADPALAANAAYAIGIMHDSGSVAALDAALDAAPEVAIEAAWALGSLATPEASGVIVRRLDERAVASRVLHALLLASAKLNPPPAGVLASYLGSTDPEFAWRAAYALGRNRSPVGVRPLLAQVLAADMLVRAQVARGLARAAAGDSLDTEALDALDLLAVAPDPHVRINAIQSLASYGERARIPILAATRDADANVRVAAARALPEVMDRDLMRWSWLWDVDTTHAYRRAVLEGATRMGVLLPSIGAWSNSRDWRERSALAAAMGAAEPHLGAQWSRSLLRDPDARVRVAALQTIGRAIDSVPGLLPLLRASVGDSSALVRAAALEAIARRASADDVPLALEALRRARTDPYAEARVAAVRVLAAAWRRDSAAIGDTLRLALALLPPPAEPPARRAGRGVTPFAHWPSAEPDPKPLAWYAEVVRELVEPAVRGTLPVMEIRTERGIIGLELFAADAPLTVHNFVSLARGGFYAGTNFHRVVPNFVAQDGDPRGDGRGGPGYTIRDELNRRQYGRGVVGMALSGPDTGGSQYFITHSPQPHLDGGYTVFGRVQYGLDVLDAILQGDRILEVVMR